MNKKKWLYYTISFLTGFVIAFFGFLQTQNALQLLIDHPTIMVICVVSALIWALLLLVTSVALLFKEEWREDAFLIFAGTNADDELEQQAVNDSIKKTFLINILILVSIVVLSGFTYTKFENPKVDKKYSFSYRLMNDYSDLNKSLEQIEKITPKNETAKEGIEIAQKLKDGKHYYLIPKVFFTPYGIMIFILLQFAMFRTFLYFNRRKFL